MNDEAQHEPERDECDRKHKHHHRHNHIASGSFGGTIWCVGWLFTIGYLHLPFFWKGVLAIIIWPYYLGASLIH